MSDRDTLFAHTESVAGFRFDAEVVKVFPDMIQRSVPGYETIIAMTGTLAERYGQASSNFYDLGCSLGASTIAMRRSITTAGCHIIAVDNSPAMIERCREVITADSQTLRETGAQTPTTVELIRADILDLEIENAAMVVMNFTLQFIVPAQRKTLIERIYRGLKPGGILILSEKIAFTDAHLNQLMIELHHAFKRANHYSELEISRKRSALENVLIPETLECHRQRLQAAGFSSIDVWFQCFNFASLLAIK
ncbi:MAG TPA: carboxy-S-adenosyl-L-methionine synthase CmoA [Porticoccaceae bacterium]|nr:carboxy-S-adenosyl-L-methionine synthase CmoA [Porticoccaceae bacterium]